MYGFDYHPDFMDTELEWPILFACTLASLSYPYMYPAFDLL